MYRAGRELAPKGRGGGGGRDDGRHGGTKARMETARDASTATND